MDCRQSSRGRPRHSPAPVERLVHCNRVIHFAVSVDAQVEYVDLVRCHFHGQQHGINAILHVEIGLALLAIAQDRQAQWIILQLLVKIEDMPMGISLAEYGYETKDARLKAEALAIRRYQPFAGGF